MVNTQPTFCLQPIQPQPNLHEIKQPKLLVVPRGRHPPIIVRSTEQASHRSRERKGPPFKKKGIEPNGYLRNKGDSVHASENLANSIDFYYRLFFLLERRTPVLARFQRKPNRLPFSTLLKMKNVR